MQIYSLSCPITLEVRYIGFTSRKNLSKRFYEHISTSSLKKPGRKNNWVKSLLKKGLTPIIEHIEDCTEENWQSLEIYWINQFKAWGFNLTNEVEGGIGLIGLKKSKEHLAKIGASLKNRIMSEITKKKMSDSAKKRKHSMTTKLKIGLIVKGRVHKEETKLKMSLASKGKPKTEKAKLNMNLVKIGKKRKYQRRRGKCIIMLDKDLNLIEEFSSIKIASEKTEILATSIVMNLKNKYKSAGGYVWKYKE